MAGRSSRRLGMGMSHFRDRAAIGPRRPMHELHSRNQVEASVLYMCSLSFSARLQFALTFSARMSYSPCESISVIFAPGSK